LTSNYNYLVTQFEIDQPEESYEEYIMNNFVLSYLENFIIYDKNKNKVFYFNNTSEYVNTTNFNTLNTTVRSHGITLNTLTTALNNRNEQIENLLIRVGNLESYHTNSEEQEPTEP